MDLQICFDPASETHGKLPLGECWARLGAALTLMFPPGGVRFWNARTMRVDVPPGRIVNFNCANWSIVYSMVYLMCTGGVEGDKHSYAQELRQYATDFAASWAARVSCAKDCEIINRFVASMWAYVDRFPLEGADPSPLLTHLEQASHAARVSRWWLVLRMAVACRAALAPPTVLRGLRRWAFRGRERAARPPAQAGARGGAVYERAREHWEILIQPRKRARPSPSSPGDLRLQVQRGATDRGGCPA